MDGAITAGVVGYSGYAGEELTRILNRHPLVTPHWVDMPRGQKQTAAVDGYKPESLEGRGPGDEPGQARPRFAHAYAAGGDQ